LGTEFNVFAYPDEEVVEATLVEGKVAIEKITKTGYAKVLGEMVPGQHVSYDIESNKISGDTGNIDKYISWREGKLIFRKDPIGTVAKRLSRWYNVDIVFADEEVKSYTYTATFVDETLIQILELMEIAAPIKYEVSQRKKLADGTFSKRRITIGLKK
jgi:ferric-dicitrate binding protein FerR (iron transport regulator)